MNHKTKDLEKVSFGIAIMFGIYWIYSCFIEQYLSIHDSFKTILSLFVLYVIGLSLFVFVTHKIPTDKYRTSKTRSQVLMQKTILLCFLLQFTAIWILTILVSIATILGIHTNPTDKNVTSFYMLFMLLIFNPIIEELVFRKLFADKLLKYGERFYMLSSSFCFAIVHGVSLGFPQIIYTFILGMIWSYLIVKTGDLKLVIIMHALSNLFGSVFTQLLLNTSIMAAGIYSILLLLLGIIGFVLFLFHKKKIVLDGKKGLVEKMTIKDVFSNKGILFYTSLTILIIILK